MQGSIGWRRSAAVSVSVLMLAVLAACGGKKDTSATQTAAKVNKEEITVHQINYVLQQQRGLRPEQAEAASKQVLERLIDQELAVQKADELKINRDPKVVQAIEAARREIIARAYVEKVGEGAARPTADEVKAYYEQKPALFKERRIYSLQEVAIEAAPAQQQEVRAQLGQAKTLAEFVEFLKSKDYKFAVNQAVRSAEQLPLAGLDRFAQMKDGQAVVNAAPNGLQVVYLAGSRPQPVDLERARPVIEQFLLNERKRELATSELKGLRSAAKIQYMGKFAEGAPGAAAPAEAASAPLAAEPASAVPAAPVPSPSPAASSGLDASSISKGMGFK